MAIARCAFFALVPLTGALLLAGACSPTYTAPQVYADAGAPDAASDAADAGVLGNRYLRVYQRHMPWDRIAVNIAGAFPTGNNPVTIEFVMRTRASSPTSPFGCPASDALCAVAGYLTSGLGGGRVVGLVRVGSDGFVGATQVGAQLDAGSHTVTDGAWHHVALVARPTASDSGTTMAIFSTFVDGTLEVTRTLEATGTATGELAIGAAVPGAIEYQSAPVDVTEVRVWNIALSSAQINFYKNRKRFGNEAGLLVYFDMTGANGAALANGPQVLVPNKASTGSALNGLTVGVSMSATEFESPTFEVGGPVLLPAE